MSPLRKQVFHRFSEFRRSLRETRISLCGLLLATQSLAWSGSSAQPASVSSSPAFIRSEFINPAPSSLSVHAPTLVETSNHDLLAAWYAGTSRGNSDTAIWVSRYAYGHWLPRVKVAEGTSTAQRQPTWHPVLFAPDTRRIFLFYKEGAGPANWSGLVSTSTDDGWNWSEPVRLPDGLPGPDRNKPILLHNGAILCPSSRQLPDGRWQVHFEASRDSGKTWQEIAPPDTALHAIQPTILARPDRSLIALGRTREGRIFQTSSTDKGKTWSPPALTDLPNPNAPIDAVALRDGRYLLVYNPTAGSNAASRSGRSPLSVALSSDAVHWQPVLTLEDGRGSFSYPAIIQTRDGLVHIVYSWNRQHIKHITLDPRKLSAPPQS